MYLPTPIFNTAVKKTFVEFGEVYTVFAGRFKDEFKGICNGKRHVRLTTFKSKHDLPHEIKFVEDDRFLSFDVGGKKNFCKKMCLDPHGK